MANDARTIQERRRELLRRRITSSGADSAANADALGGPAGASTRQPTARPAGVRHPLSTGQRRMWFLQNLDAADTTLNICVAFELAGAVDEARLRRAFDSVVAHHDILRTRYGTDADGEPYQLAGDSEICWQSCDVADIGITDRNSRVEELARADFGTPFDLTVDTPLRITFVRTGAAKSVLIFTVHHICWDDDCWGVFFGEVSAAYRRFATDREPGLGPTQYAAVAVGSSYAEPTDDDITYWRANLHPPPEPLELPGPAASRPSKAARRRTRAFPSDVTGRVEIFARQHRASAFMVWLAAFGVLVRRYTGAADFLVSVPVTQRAASSQGAIGYFGDTLLLRLAPAERDTFAAFVDAVRDTCLGGYSHQSVGVDQAVREANPDRSAGRDGMEQLVRLGFSTRANITELLLDGVTVRQLELSAVTAQLPLALAIVHTPEGTVAEFEYHTDVLADALIDQLLEHYVRLLDDGLRDPQRLLAELDMLGSDGRAAVLAQSHGNLVEMPATTITDMLDSSAAANAKALAVVSDSVELTYAQLHGRVNRLARWLIATRIGSEDIVGLRMSTSVEFVVAMLAVLKAGAAYLPIDPAYPDERIDYLVGDGRPKIVMGVAELRAAEAAAAPLSEAAVTDADRLRPLRPDHLAYVIYTSGSTGRPKGVAVAHRAIAEHIEGFVAEWSMTADDRLLQSSSVSFDASLLDIFVTLSLGAALIVPKPDAFGDIPYVAELIDRHGVTVLHMVPSMLSTLLLLPQARQWRQLRHVPVGGEALPGDVAERFAGYFDAELRNHYGPTEAVVCSTHMVVTGPRGAGPVPIGRPNRNVHAYVLDHRLQPVPAQVIGELYLGGAQLARGYLQRRGLTAHRFVADPFTPGMRLYRSGDLVRRNLDGELEFVGRADEQVKIRGYRVELGEVEAVIATHPSVGHCLVIAEETDVGPVLAAYVVPVVDRHGPNHPAPLDVEELRAHAAAVLPGYMVPSAFATIPDIPLTVSGKLDKRALPVPTAVAVRGYREPATAAERAMCGIFARLFGCERVGADDSFFDLGGHSLLAARLVAQIRAEFGSDCAVRAVFDTPTPAGLAAGLLASAHTEPDAAHTGSGGGRTSGRQPSRPDLVHAARPPHPPLSYSQLAMWFHYRMRGPNDVFNMALGLRFTGPLNTTALAEAVNDVVARHEPLRTNFAEHDGVPYQVVHPARDVHLAVVQTPADGTEEMIAGLRRHVFALETDSLIKPTLVAADSDSHTLLLLVHHIVTDHTSLGVLFDDLLDAYRARLSGRAPHWEAPSVHFADYARWQRDTFDTPGLWAQAELAHWREVLAELPGDISVVPDHTRPTILRTRGHVATFTIDTGCRGAIATLAERCHATEFMAYQAALAVLLHKLGGGTDIAIGSPVAARVGAAAADLTGPCANVVVLRTRLPEDATLRTVLSASRDTVLDALAHQDLPIERLVEALNPPRSPSRNHPLFQNSIHFRGDDWALTPRDLTGTGETTVVPIPTEFEVSLLDLNVSVDAIPGGELSVRVVANADLYEPPTVTRIADAFDAVLDALATTPDLPVSALEVLPPDVLAELLTEAAPSRIEPSAPVVGGSASTERALIVLLEELLDIADVDREDNFFALGGDSIVSVQWSSRATAQGLTLTPAMVFAHTTIAELAAAVDNAAVDNAAVDNASEPPGADAHSATARDEEPVNASGLDDDALAELTASWLNEQ